MSTATTTAPQLRLRILSFHLRQILLCEAPASFTLHTCDGGRSYRVKIRKGEHGDEVDIDGVPCGKRADAIDVFFRLIQEEQPEIHLDND